MDAPASIPNSITCDACRQRWIRYHDEQGRPIRHCPIGYATIYLCNSSKETYLNTARSYADLRTIASKLEAGTSFSVRLCIFLEIVGIGHYLKTAEGLEVLGEDEATEGLWLAMEESPQEDLT